MAWNEPGKPGQDPWGNSGNGGNNGGDNEPPKQPKKPKNSDPDLDAMLKKAQSILGGAGNKMGNGGSGIGGFGGSVIFGVIVVVWLLSGIYIVDPAERGVVTRFGAFVEETKAGPHWHMPYPIETVRIVNVDQIRTAEVGYRSGVDTRNNRSGDVPNESLMLTKDENIVDLKIAVQYKIESANSYLFQTADPDLTLRAVSESALREVVGQNTMDFVLTEGRNEVVSKVQELAQANLNAYQTGLLITSVNLQDAQPPEQVQSAFADVVKAREDRERLINEAEAYANDILPKARGKAARELEEASAYHDRVIAQATGEASRFTSIVTEYKKAPEVTRNRLYIDAVTTVLGNTSKVFMGSENSNNLMYLPLDKMMGGQSSVPFSANAPQPASQAAQAAPATPAANTTQQRPGIRDYLRNRELR